MKGFFFRFCLLSVSIAFFSCDHRENAFRLVDARESGIDFINQLSPSADVNILSYLYYYNGGGVAIADFNNDNLNDLYLTSNQGADKLYLNKGGFRFEDVTGVSNIKNSEGWTTGVTHVDINNDGLLDIYVCKVGGYKTFEGANLLFVNQGLNNKGVAVFKEDAKSFGLDLSTFATQSAFFDYDLDGDLDMFLLTHSVHPNRSYGCGDNRLVRDPWIGDKLLENREGKFVDVTGESGIFENKIGYGLGVSIGDLNNDGYPDIYVGNDFFENDYCYSNNGDKTFRELISTDTRIFGHTSHYSMGNTVSDINNDGRMDILSLDMLPEDLVTLKSSGVEDGYPIYNQFLRNGYAPQYMQNTLHLNRGDEMFSEIGFLSGLAATEWSWGVLAADFDLDGWKDVYISNGIVGATNDMDYINFISQENIQRQIEDGNEKVTTDFSKQMPEKKVRNYAFRNNGDITFSDVTKEWFDAPPSFSNGCAYGDLDNDGDLDVVVNNIGEKAFVFENRLQRKEDHGYLRLRFSGPDQNRFGVGCRVEVYAGALSIAEDNFPVRSYLSAVPNEIIVGIGSHSVADSIRVIWPDRRVEVSRAVKANSTIVFSHTNSTTPRVSDDEKKLSLASNSVTALPFTHREQTTLDFDRDPLVPFALSHEGPRVTVADINNDSLDDVFIGGAKMQVSELFIQNRQGTFQRQQSDAFKADAMAEDVDQVFLDADGDGDLDLVVVSAGNEFQNGEPLRPRLYLNARGSFHRKDDAFVSVGVNASVVKSFDMENDGDLDIIIGSNALPGKFGETSVNYIFLNNGSGEFKMAERNVAGAFTTAGLINDVEVIDMDGNGFQDIVAVGDWMPVTIFLNNGKSMKPHEIPDSEGWWKAIDIADFDRDGDLDLVAGNWGNNTRLNASKDQPVELYRDDFDGNGAIETIITYYYQGAKTLLSSKDELQRQIPLVKKKFQSYQAFAKSSVGDVVTVDGARVKKKVVELSTCYFENKGQNDFFKRILPMGAQQSSVNAILIDDLNGDSYVDILLAGNNYEISTQLGRLDASHGVILLNDKTGFFMEYPDQKLNIAGPARDIDEVVIGGQAYYIVAINNSEPIFLKKER